MKIVFGDKITRAVDKIWATKGLKYKGIGDETLKKMNEVFYILLIVHFEKTLGELRKVIDRQKMHYEVFKTTWDLSNFTINRLAQDGIKYAVLLSDILPELMRYERLSKQMYTKGKKIHIVVAERYPIPERDNKILSYAAQLSQFTTVSFHTALDEPMMRLFGSDSIAGLVKKLGWNEATFTAHPMITKAITEIQRKIKRQSIGDQRVRSQEEWFYYNFPQSRDRLK